VYPGRNPGEASVGKNKDGGKGSFVATFKGKEACIVRRKIETRSSGCLRRRLKKRMD